MTKEDLEVLANFGAVWERVSGASLGEAERQGDTWAELLQGLEQHWQGCRQLSVLAVGSHGKRLQKLAREAERLFRRVQTERFLEAGDLVYGGENLIFASYTPYNFRKLCKSAVKLAEHLQKAEEDEGFP